MKLLFILILLCFFLLLLCSCSKSIEAKKLASSFITQRTKISIQLETDTLVTDGVMIFLDNTFSYDIGDDDSYKWTNPDENLAIVPNGASTDSKDYLATKMLSITGQPYGADTIQLWTSHLSEKQYSLRIQKNTGVDLALYDAIEHKKIPINNESIYTFTPSINDNLRFSCIIK